MLVTGAGGSAGNNVCWSLRVCPDGKKLSIIGTDTDRTSLELNRWLDDAYEIPRADHPRYLPILNKIIQRKNVEGIFPQPDPEVKTISHSNSRLETKTFLPEPETVKKCLDKNETLKIWHNAKLRNQSHLLTLKNGDLNDQIHELKFPSWVRAREGAGGLMSCLATDPKVLEYWIRFHWAQGLAVDFIAEEYLPGRDYCFMSLWQSGKLVTSMVRERLSWVGPRTIGTGGTSKLNRVIHSNVVNSVATEAIHTITSKPHGVLCVDLKENVDGAPRPTEVNCRFTTNVHYLTLAAVKYGKSEWNFPWLAARLMVGEEIPQCKAYDALPDNLWFTKNVDMGYTIVENQEWRAAPVR